MSQTVVNPYRYAGGIIPSDVSNLYAWWDFSGEYSVITKDGSNRISECANNTGLSATELDMLQATGADQPLWVSAGQNGKDCADFSDNRWLQTDDAVNNVSPVSQPVTYLTACFIPAGSENWLFDRGSGWGTNYNDSRQNFGKSTDTTWFSDGAWTTWTMTATDQWSYITTIFNGSSGLLRENGVENSAGAGATGARKISAGTLGAGSEPVSGESHMKWNEEVGELIMYDRALTTEEIEGLESYLATKWGL